MNTTRNGKIAQLSVAVREELNRRLDDGESGPRLLAWLNALPVVQATLDSRSWRPINPPNLTAWRQGGYRDWRAELEARELDGLMRREVPDHNCARALLLISREMELSLRRQQNVQQAGNTGSLPLPTGIPSTPGQGKSH